MYNTKCDVSADNVKLDYNALLLTAKVAFRETLNQINRNVSILYNIPYKYDVELYLTSGDLKKSANELAQISEVLYSIEKMKTRQDVEFIDRIYEKEE